MLPKLAEQLLALRRQREDMATQVQTLVEAHPLYEVLTSMPGIGVRTCARILPTVRAGTPVAADPAPPSAENTQP